ncbi:hypothetical protein CIPAW_12G140800 [Carya illinoinensis]|uniref:Uncharacterized protein n=1 Tax=Carya illinoinensis TaxID=32201 RepID=A0A8T1NX86_CARIL|nr:hypothetical protein CIPAW_12G140800 [Carya illinoinensis]
MGKRKERRLAAQSNAGRRVKLDLCAEPSGDLGGSTEYDEIGVDKDSNHRDGLPNSPTSSGGFRRFSSKGLCRKELSAQHFFGGNMELYVRDLILEVSTIFFLIGQQPQNPLLLLGQYSDDEFDEESNQGLNHAVAETFSSNEEVIN